MPTLALSVMKNFVAWNCNADQPIRSGSSSVAWLVVANAVTVPIMARKRMIDWVMTSHHQLVDGRSGVKRPGICLSSLTKPVSPSDSGGAGMV